MNPPDEIYPPFGALAIDRQIYELIQRQAARQSGLRYEVVERLFPYPMLPAMNRKEFLHFINTKPENPWTH